MKILSTFLLILAMACDNQVDSEKQVNLPSKVVVGDEETAHTRIQFSAFLYDQASSDAISNAKVTFYDEGEKIEIATNEDGYFYVVGFPPGEYKFPIELDGYEDIWYCVDLKHVTQAYGEYKKDIRIPLYKQDSSLNTTLKIENNGFISNANNVQYFLTFSYSTSNNGDRYWFKSNGRSGITSNGELNINGLPNVTIYMRAYYNQDDLKASFYECTEPYFYNSTYVRSVYDYESYLSIESTNIADATGNSIFDFDKSGNIVIHFSKSVTSGATSNVSISQLENGNPVYLQASLSNASKTLTINPQVDLDESSFYVLKISYVSAIENGSLSNVYLMFSTL